MNQFRVTADIEYLDGALAGLLIPAGYTVPCPDRHHAQRVAMWLTRIQRQNDFIRAAVTGHRYQVRGNIEVQELKPLVYA